MTTGARLSRPIAQTKPGWDFDYEALWQFGSFGSANIRAWTVASETGYRLPTVPLKLRFSAKADISSGDDFRTNTLGRFNPLFPKGNYFGVIATVGPGPINFIDVHPRIETALPHGVTASADWIFQWRESFRDGVYSVPGFLIIPAGKSNARFVGHRPGTEVRWQANRHLWFQADYGIFTRGNTRRNSLKRASQAATSITGHCGPATRWTGHGPGERRFADSICGASIPPGGGFSVCCVVLRHRIPSRFAGTFFLTVCSDRLNGARDGHTECRCPEARNPGSDDNGPDINDYGHRRGLFARGRKQPEIGEKGCVSRRNVFGCGLGCSRHTSLDLSGPMACDRNFRRVQFSVVSLCAHVR
jgi:hypothetical protein